MSTPTPPPQPEPWKLPDPPAGQQWHRTDGWTADMLPSGFRPLLKGEREEIGDEWLNPRNYGWEKVKDVVNYTPDHYTDHRRTTRPLPPSAEAQPESANAVNVEEPPKSAGQAVKRELMRMQDTEWDSVAEAAIAWHLSHQPKPPSPEKRENPLEARGIHLSSKPEGKTKDGSIAVAQPSPPELKIEGWPSLEEFEREWPRSTIPGTLLYFIYMRVISLANARIEAAQFEKEQAINREAEKLAALLKVESERDTALEKVKEAEQAKNVEAERIMRIWSDCLGNMLYPKLHFIDALGKTTRRLNEDKTKALEEADKLRAELSRLTAATQQAQGGWISTAERMPTESDGGFHGEVLWAWDDARRTPHHSLSQ